MLNRKGFTMVELLVVLVIIAILATVATPLYLANVQRAKVSEAVATMSLIRQALREYKVKSGTYLDVPFLAAEGQIQLPLPTIANPVSASGVTNPQAGLAIDVGTARYFSNSAYNVAAIDQTPAAGASGKFVNPPSVGFIITADGSTSKVCPGLTIPGNCAAILVKQNAFIGRADLTQPLNVWRKRGGDLSITHRI